MQKKSTSEIPAEAWQSLIASMSGTNPNIDAVLVREFCERHQIAPESVVDLPTSTLPSGATIKKLKAL